MNKQMSNKRDDSDHDATESAFSFSITDAFNTLAGVRKVQAKVKDEIKSPKSTPRKPTNPTSKASRNRKDVHISPTEYALTNEFHHALLEQRSGVLSSLSEMSGPENSETNNLSEHSSDPDYLQVLSVNEHCLSDKSMGNSMRSDSSACFGNRGDYVAAVVPEPSLSLEEIDNDERRQDVPPEPKTPNANDDGEYRDVSASCMGQEGQCSEWRFGCGLVQPDYVVEPALISPPFLLSPVDSFEITGKEGAILASSPHPGRPLLDCPILDCDASDTGSIQMIAEVGFLNSNSNSISQSTHQPDSATRRSYYSQESFRNERIELYIEEEAIDMQWKKGSTGERSSSSSISSQESGTGGSQDRDSRLDSNQASSEGSETQTMDLSTTEVIEERYDASGLPFFAEDLKLAPSETCSEGNPTSDNSSQMSSSSSLLASGHSDSHCSISRSTSEDSNGQGWRRSQAMRLSGSGSSPASKHHRIPIPIGNLLPRRKSSLLEENDDTDSSLIQQIKGQQHRRSSLSQSKSSRSRSRDPEGDFLNRSSDPEGDILNVASMTSDHTLEPDGDLRNALSYRCTPSSPFSAARLFGVKSSSEYLSSSSSSVSKENASKSGDDTMDDETASRSSSRVTQTMVSATSTCYYDESDGILEVESDSGERTFETNDSFSFSCQPNSSKFVPTEGYASGTGYASSTGDEQSLQLSVESTSQLLKDVRSCGMEKESPSSSSRKSNHCGLSSSQLVDGQSTSRSTEETDGTQAQQEGDHIGNKQDLRNRGSSARILNENSILDTHNELKVVGSKQEEGREAAKEENGDEVECSTSDDEKVEVVMLNNDIMVGTPMSRTEPNKALLLTNSQDLIEVAADSHSSEEPILMAGSEGNSCSSEPHLFIDEDEHAGQGTSSLTEESSSNPDTTSFESLKEPYAIRTKATAASLLSTLIRKVESYDAQIIANKTRRQLLRTALLQEQLTKSFNDMDKSNPDLDMGSSIQGEAAQILGCRSLFSDSDCSSSSDKSSTSSTTGADQSTAKVPPTSNLQNSTPVPENTGAHEFPVYPEDNVSTDKASPETHTKQEKPNNDDNFKLSASKLSPMTEKARQSVEIHINFDEDEIDLMLASVSASTSACASEADASIPKDDSDDDHDIGTNSVAPEVTENDAENPPDLTMSNVSQESFGSEQADILSEAIRQEDSRQRLSMAFRILNILSKLTKKKSPDTPLHEPLLPLSASTLENPFWLSGNPYASSNNICAQDQPLRLVFSNTSSQDDDLDIEEGRTSLEQTDETWRSLVGPNNSLQQPLLTQEERVIHQRRTSDLCIKVMKRCCKIDFLWGLLASTVIFSALLYGFM